MIKARQIEWGDTMNEECNFCYGFVSGEIVAEILRVKRKRVFMYRVFFLSSLPPTKVN